MRGAREVSRLHPRRGLTVMEVLVAVTLIILLLGSLLTFFWQTMETRDIIRADLQQLQLARQILGNFQRELSSTPGLEEFGFNIEQPIIDDEQLLDDEAIAFVEEEDPVEGEEGEEGDLAGQLGDLLGGGEAGVAQAEPLPLLIGTRRSITYITTQMPDEARYDFFDEAADVPPGRHDFTQVSYRLWIDPEETDEEGEPIVGGLIRTEKRTLNQFLIDLEEPLQVRNDLWAPEIGYLEFRYFDGAEWTTTWNVTQGNSLPQLIQVTIGFDTITNDELEDRDLDQYPLEQYPFGDEDFRPQRYTVIIRLPAADRFFSSRMQRLGQEMSDQLGLEGL